MWTGQIPLRYLICSERDNIAYDRLLAGAGLRQTSQETGFLKWKKVQDFLQEVRAPMGRSSTTTSSRSNSRM